MPYITDLPDAMSTSSRIIVSVRRLTRPTPSSIPVRRMLSLPSAAHCSGGVFGPLTFSTGKIGIPSPVVGPGVGAGPVAVEPAEGEVPADAEADEVETEPGASVAAWSV